MMVYIVITHDHHSTTKSLVPVDYLKGVAVANWYNMWSEDAADRCYLVRA